MLKSHAKAKQGKRDARERKKAEKALYARLGIGWFEHFILTGSARTGAYETFVKRWYRLPPGVTWEGFVPGIGVLRGEDHKKAVEELKTKGWWPLGEPVPPPVFSQWEPRDETKPYWKCHAGKWIAPPPLRPPQRTN